MFTLGITGGIGSGKSFVTKLFSDKNILIVDADEVSREVVTPGQPALEAIKEHFGLTAFSADGLLDRRALRERIFNNIEDKIWLEELLHPLIRASVRRKLQGPSSSPYAIYSAPLLFEQKQESLVDKVVVVDCPVDQQIERAMKRDGSGYATIRKILDQQISRDERLAKADYIVDNSNSMDDTLQQVEQIHQAILKLHSASKNEQITHSP